MLGVQPNRSVPVHQRNLDVVDIVIDQHRRFSVKLLLGMPVLQLLDGAGHELLLAPPRPTALVVPAAIPSPDDDPIGEGRKVCTEDLLDKTHLRREGHDGQVQGGIGRGAEEVQELGTNVRGQFGSRAVPLAAGVNVDDGLVKVNREEVDLD